MVGEATYNTGWTCSRCFTRNEHGAGSIYTMCSHCKQWRYKRPFREDQDARARLEDYAKQNGERRRWRSHSLPKFGATSDYRSAREVLAPSVSHLQTVVSKRRLARTCVFLFCSSHAFDSAALWLFKRRKCEPSALLVLRSVPCYMHYLFALTAGTTHRIAF